MSLLSLLFPEKDPGLSSPSCSPFPCSLVFLENQTHRLDWGPASMLHPSLGTVRVQNAVVLLFIHQNQCPAPRHTSKGPLAPFLKKAVCGDR